MTGRPTRRSLLAAAGGALGLIGLAACSSATPSTALASGGAKSTAGALTTAGPSGGAAPSGAVGVTPTATPTSAAPAAPSAADVAAAQSITVTGGSTTAAPAVTLTKTPLTVSTLTTRVVTPGTGEAATASQSVVVKMVLYQGKDGSQVANTDAYPDPKGTMIYLSGDQLLPALTHGFVGATKGETRLIVAPPASLWGSQGNTALGIAGTDNLVIVATVLDVLPTQAPGSEITQAGAGLPSVALSTGGAPMISLPGGAAPTSTVTKVLTEGGGATVAAGQQLLVQYTGVIWSSGKVFDSTWATGVPRVFSIGDGSVIPAWDKSFVGAKVGSRMLVVAPPADGYGSAGSPQAGISGTDTLVFVVDILAAY